LRRRQFRVPVAEQKIPAVFVMVVARRLSVRGKNRVAGPLRLRVDLPVGYQRLLRVAEALNLKIESVVSSQ